MPETVEDLWTKNPERIRSLIEALDTVSTPFQKALIQGDTMGACRILLDHFRTLSRDWVITTIDPVPDFRIAARRLMEDSIVLSSHLVKIPTTSEGGWKWNFNGDIRDDEIGYKLNGLVFLTSLYLAHQETKEPALIGKYDIVSRDWILHHPLPPPGDSIYIVLDTNQTLDYRDIGEVEWRTLETGNRLGVSWIGPFYALQSDPAFKDATRLLILSAIAEEAAYLRRYHQSKHNWTTMEMNGLALASLAFPEFKKSQEWRDYALEVMNKEINRQVYPDGVQTEVSTKTQWVALNRFESVAEHFQKAGQPVSKEYLQRLEDMYNYLAFCMRPDGHQPLNNDSDREDLRERVLAAAKKYSRPDWTWIATNGREGILPDKGPSLVFPWGGMHIMRNGWQREAQWAFFDIGPFGSGHQHRDKLHISISAFGKDFLVDGGRYTHQDYFSFDPTVWRGYFRSSFSHNLILIDGHGQNDGAYMAVKPLVEGNDYVINDQFEYSWGTFDLGFEKTDGKADHTRSVFYLKNQYWVVLDKIITDRPRTIDVLWHFHPDHEVIVNDYAVITNHEDGPNFSILPAGNIDWQVSLVSGQESPTKQGWYSANYGEKIANTTAIYQAKIPGSTTFAWLLLPSEKNIADATIGLNHTANSSSIEVQITDLSQNRIEIPDNNDPQGVKLVKLR
ncbi:MAG: alginate lyase family protein [Saprospiraceae bacterium]|nr:alginate lyase family protein [Saprospiraceae bacterium]